MKTSSPDLELTPKHVRAARALLAWSQQNLAEKAGVATSTVADFERGHRTPVVNNANAIRKALEDADISFLPTGAVIGPPLPSVAANDHPGLPVRWVTAEDLTAWADRIDSASTLPTLISYLIRATHGATAGLYLPSDAGVRNPGWDGWTDVKQGSRYVPAGWAGWELSVQRKDIVGKADSDYFHRIDAPQPMPASESTFIFVTARHWPAKDKWASEKTATGKWREVRAYDVTDLVHWIEQTPAVGAWLANYLGKRPSGVRELEDAWNEWSNATQWPMSEDLVLSDRDEDAAEILRWLRGAPSVMSIQANDTEEAAAFFNAAISMLPEGAQIQYRVRTLIVTGEAARQLQTAPGPLILLLTEPDSGLAHSIAQKGHFVLQLYDDRPTGQGQVRKLARPEREGIEAALVNTGVPEARAESLAKDCNRNLAVLRRLIPTAPGGLPTWAATTPPDALLAAMLCGSWNSEVEGDKDALAYLAGQSYDEVEKALGIYVGDFDKPLRKVGTTWHIASPPDAWLLLAQHLHPARLNRFQEIALRAFETQKHSLPQSGRQLQLDEPGADRPTYSGLLRHGVGEVLVLLALWGDRAHLTPLAKDIPALVVKAAFANADGHRWRDLARDLRLLAEASPDAFLDAIETSLDQNDPPIASLFRVNDDSIYGEHLLAHLCWALESLAWSQQLMPRVSLILARLAAIDTTSVNFQNRPAVSLRDIFLFWHPQTTVLQEQRLKVLDLIRRKEPIAAWNLMLGVLPGSHDMVTPAARPRWRDYTAETSEEITWGLIGKGAEDISIRLMDDARGQPARLEALIDRISDLPDPLALISLLETEEAQMGEPAARSSLRKRLRQLLHSHREFPDAQWALDAAEIDRIDAIYMRLTPPDLAEQHAWLFSLENALPNPSKEGWKGEERQRDQLRQEAVREIYQREGTSGLLRMSTLVEFGGYIGEAIVRADLDRQTQDEILVASLNSSEKSIRNLAHGMIVTTIPILGTRWARSWLDKAMESDWGEETVLTILLALPSAREVWTWVEALGAEIRTAYWKSIQRIWLKDFTPEDQRFALEKLIEVGRARHAIHLAGLIDEYHLPSEFIVKLLETAARQPFDNSGENNENAMFKFYVIRLLKVLDERTDLDLKVMPQLEWIYLSLLERSERPAKALIQALSESPPLFIQMLSAIYAREDERDEPHMPQDREAQTRLAIQAYRLLDHWKEIPGTREDGSIDPDALESWISRTRELAVEAGRPAMTDYRIGMALSASRMGEDGLWPAEPIRYVLDLFRNVDMLNGFCVGKMNRRGVTTRHPDSGGTLERMEAAKYRAWAEGVQYDYRHTAKALIELADHYERDAVREDERVERSKLIR